MSGRCRSCNAILEEDEMKRKWPGSEEYCDLCSYCLHASNEDFDHDDFNEDINMDLLPESLE